MKVIVVDKTLVRVEMSLLPDRYAVPGPGARWTFDHSGRAVDVQIQAAIDRELRSVRSATAPPG